MSTNVKSNESFISSRRFYDDKNYPRGMNRSGEYSIAEVNLLEKYGVALHAISTGSREAITDDEIQFKKVCDGQCAPQTAIEKAWIKYQTKVLTPKQFHTLFGKRKVEASADESIEDNISTLD